MGIPQVIWKVSCPVPQVWNMVTNWGGYLLIRKSPDSVKRFLSHRIGGLLLELVVEQASGGLGSSVEEYQGNLQVVIQQEVLNGVNRHLQSLVLGVAVDPGGDQGKGHTFAVMSQSQL